MRQTVIFFLIFAVAFYEAQGKTRSPAAAQKECDEIKERLRNSSTNGRLQWEPSCLNEFTYKDDSEFGFGIDFSKPKKPVFKSGVIYSPQNRLVPVKPGETSGPTGSITLPQSYDARKVYGGVCPSFNHVVNQGRCENCWAVATVSMINDRVCMHNWQTNRTQKYYSSSHLTTCAYPHDPIKCVGGWPGEAMDYWIIYGIPTGGNAEALQPSGCQPYPANATEMTTSQCIQLCHDINDNSCKYKSFGGARYEILSRNQTEIMYEIYFYGPVVSTFWVYDDFRLYQKGVYRRVSNNFKTPRAHSVKVSGWGTEDGIPYWYATNSWGTKWGEGGFFKIQRGTNEVGFEGTIDVGVPAEGLHEGQMN